MGYFWVIVLFPLVWPWIARAIFNTELTYAEMSLNIVIAFLLSAGIYYGGRYSSMADYEVLNGEVIGKSREITSCEHSYSCNCRTVQSCSGSGKNRSCSTSTVCDTCYEHSNDYDYRVKSNVGDFLINRVDRQGVSYPKRWVSVKNGDTVAMLHEYVNYVKAASDSLFHNELSILSTFNGKLPAYPLDIKDYQYIDRVLVDGITIPNISEWNAKLANILKTLGPQRQMNVVLVITTNTNPEYAQALKAYWQGGKKNDAIIVVGVSDYPTIGWVRVLSWSSDDMFNVSLRDKIWDLKTLAVDEVMRVIENESMTYFKRRPMAEFEYLKDAIEPSTWVIVLAGVLGVVVSLGLTVLFCRRDIDIKFPWQR